MNQSLLAASGLTIVFVGMSVLVHYEALNLLNNWVHRFKSTRLGLLTTMFGLLVAHMVEIWLFGFGYMLAAYLELGQLTPPLDSWFDAIYYSAMVYTTVGFGDLIPEGALRMITSGEAIAGLSLITWSASFAFLQMTRVWDGD